MISKFKVASNGNGQIASLDSDADEFHPSTEEPEYENEMHSKESDNGKSKGGNGKTENIAPAEVIKLDDDDFGDF